jgi:hypothetical protein
VLIEWVARKSISFRLVSHPSFKEMVQRANPDLSVPVYSTPKHHIKHLAEVYRQLSGRKKKSHCFLLVDRAKPFGRRFPVLTMFMERHVRFVDLKALKNE